jgi:NADPH2 dehydrogenase
VDQFLNVNSNKRTDAYGGSVANRARFALEVADAVAAAVGPERTGFRISPYSPFQGLSTFPHSAPVIQRLFVLRWSFPTEMKMDQRDIEETFGYFARELKKRQPNLAYLHAVESRVLGTTDIAENPTESLDFLVRFGHVLT